jgi:hypothetical protein
MEKIHWEGRFPDAFATVYALQLAASRCPSLSKSRK